MNSSRMDTMSLGSRQTNATSLYQRQTLKHQKVKAMQFQIVKDDPVYPGLRKLKLKGRDLEFLPNELFTLTDLEVLDLSPEREACLFYQLQEVPPSISKLANLRVLMLDTNDLEELPPEICRLPQLERVSLSNNNLQTLPKQFGSLNKLKSLHLSNNEFEKLPKEIFSLKALEFLDMCDNKLIGLPPQVASLKNLHSLLLFINKLKSLPDELCDLVQLRSLWIGSNNISKLPESFGQLKCLDWGTTGRHTVSAVLGGNPLTEPPPEICLRGAQAISEYFAARRPTPEPDRSSPRRGLPPRRT